ncbi:hypothetical protein N9B23_02555, partial [bacterium]|nr:hypothetical protein [bacterium]
MSSESNNLANDQNAPSPSEVASSSAETVVPTESSGAPATEVSADKVSASATASPTVTEDPPVPVAAPVRKVAIGSQRDAADKALQPSQPRAVQNAVANPINLTGEPEPEPVVLPDIKSDTGFSDDVDAEIDAVLGEISMDDVVATTEASVEEIEPGTRVKAAITKIHEDNVFVRLSGQSEGVATLHHFKEAPKEGDLVEIIVRGLNK